MGFGGIGPVQLIIILVIVLLIFGTKKLRNLGGDLGGAIKGFKKAVKEENPDPEFASESDQIASESDQNEEVVAEAGAGEPVARKQETETGKS